jgi:putative inorganic carbon (hco3(-)) transporter
MAIDGKEMNMHTILKRSGAWVDRVALLSLPLITPLLLFPYGALPFVALGLWLALIVWRWAALGPPRPRVEDVPLVILLVMALAGFGISIDRALSWPRLCSITLGLIMFFELRRALPADRHHTHIAVGLIGLGLGLAGVGFLGVNWSQVRLLDLPALYDRLPTLIRGLPNSRAFSNQDLIGPRMLGITMGVMAPVYLPLLGWREKPWLRVLAALAFVVTAGILLLTQTLSGILALLVGIFVVLVLVNRWFWLLLPAGVAAGAGLMLWLNPLERLTALLSIDDLGGIAVLLRLDMWSRAWAMIRDLPFTGIGLNTFPLIQSQFYTGYIIGPEPDAHNLLLQTAVDLGLPGLMAFMGS